ncbi:hypothetical protein, partial [Shewanella sp. SG41-4]|uniref:hypothetical protein n=1 Tax=Shewanella sp. SG41-4 TaxID=2760976 RepID=UPI001C72002A
MKLPQNLGIYSLLASAILVSACGGDSDSTNQGVPTSSTFEICSESLTYSINDTNSQLTFTL